MTSFLSRLSGFFGGGPAAAKETEPVEYRGFMIIAAPFRDGSQWRLAGRITSADPNDGRAHHFIRSDVFTNAEDAGAFAVRKAQLIIDQLGAKVLDDPGVKPPDR